MNNKAVYAARRQKLMQQLEKNSIVVLAAAPEYLRNGDIHFPFRQNSHLYYLTGFNEPETVMLLMPGREEGEFVLFNRPRDPEQETWNGRRFGQEGAMKLFGANQAYDIDELEARFPAFLNGIDNIYFPIGKDVDLDDLVFDSINSMRKQVRSGAGFPCNFHAIGKLIDEMRLHKDEHEVELMRRSCQISVEAHKRAMNICKPGLKEYHLEAELLKTFCENGSRQPGYPSIVGAGANGCILHYMENNAEIKDGDLVLIDAGAEYGMYSADITRTFPANGRFSPEQKAIYELVLKAQLAALDITKPGTLWTDLQDVIVDVMVDGFLALGLLKGDKQQLIDSQAYMPFYMHKSGHFLGLDTHDVGAYKQGNEWRHLEVGMVLTVEPGIYISDSITQVDPKWHNIGVRIEDDILITKDGHENLTAGLPKTIAEIEALVGTAS